MVISLNGENVDYKIETETNLGDVIDSMGSWLRRHDMIFSDITVNGEKVDINDNSWRQKEIKDTQKLDAQALNLDEAYYVQFSTGRDFFYLLSRTAQKGDIEALKDFTASWDEFKHHIIELFKEEPGEVEKLFHGIEKSGFPLNQKPDMVRLSHSSSLMLELLNRRCLELEKPDQIAMETANELASHAEIFDEVGVKFQTGKDKEAIETIIYLTEKLQILIRCLRLTQFTDTRIASLNDKLNKALRELESALENSDTVQIGDLLEYEIKPILVSLPSEINPQK